MAAKKHTKPPAKYLAKKKAEQAEKAAHTKKENVKSISYTVLRVLVPRSTFIKEAKLSTLPVSKISTPQIEGLDENAMKTELIANHFFKSLLNEVRKMRGPGENYWELGTKNLSITIDINKNHIGSIIAAREYIATVPYITKAEVLLDVFMSDDTAESFGNEKIERKADAITVTKLKPLATMDFSTL